MRIAGLLVAAISLGIGHAHATTVTIQSTDAIWNYGGTQVAGYLSTTPTITAIAPGTGRVLTFSSVTGALSLTPGYTYGPDGGVSCPPGACPMIISAAAGLSGIVSGHSAFLAAVFLNGNEASSHATPATLTFNGAGAYSFGSLSPLDDQVFFVGDGLTDAGTQQVFNVPTDATELVLGITDANGYSGPPGAYFDNTGSFTATFSVAAATVPTGVPEPASIVLLAGGLLLTGLRRRAAETGCRESGAALPG